MKKEEADSLIRRRNLLSWEFWSPDEIAETTIGLTSAMCRRLWASLKEMPSPMSSFECDDPSAYMESNAIVNVWDFFTPEEQRELGVHAEIHEDLREEAVVDRMIAYGGVGDQLDMMYKDQLNGTTTWKDHVANVKATTTKPGTIAEFVPDPKKTQLVGRNSWDPWVDNWVPT